MASAEGTGTVSEDERRWVVVGICLNTVLAPVLRKVVKTALGTWYGLLCRPPQEIHKQTPKLYKRNLPPSTYHLNYKNINGNIHKPPRTYDYAVRDELSLAKLFLMPFMEHATAFDALDLSALLAVMSEAAPFVPSGAGAGAGAGAEARELRSQVRNPWAHCNTSEWTLAKFNASIQAMKSLVKSINLPTDDEKSVYDDLDFWKRTDILVDGCHAKKVTDSIAELCNCVKNWKLENDTEKNAVLENLDNISKLLCRVEEVENRIERVENSMGKVDDNMEIVENLIGEVGKSVAKNASEIECLKQWTERQHAEEESYFEFVEEKVPYGLRYLPHHLIERTSEVTEVLELLKKGNKVGVVGRRGVPVGIRGMGGLGKTVLAQAVAWEVSKSRQVVWLDIGQTPDRLALINTLVKVLGGARKFPEIVAAQSWLQKNTIDKDCFVVLDDVWNVDHATVFDCLSGKCQLLITTRDAEVLGGLGASKYELPIMEQERSRALLYQSAKLDPNEQLTSNFQRIITGLLEQCRGLPLSLSLVGSCLSDTRADQDWEDILDHLKNADLTKIPSSFSKVVYPYDNLFSVIDVSYQAIQEKNAREMFLHFAIFPEDTDIPSDILELLWKSSCEPQEQRKVLVVLEGKSLIQKGPDINGKSSYRVHDSLLDFAQTKLRATGTLTDVQSSFVKTLRSQCVNGKWNTASTRNQKDYYFKYLPFHIYSSEQESGLLQLIFDLHWLKGKVKHTNIPSVVSDFRFLSPESAEIRLLKSSLILSADVIEKNPDSICQQLLGGWLSYGEKYPRVKTLLEQLRETCTKTCHLLPLFSCLELGGPEISRKTFDSEVWSLATYTRSDSTVVICGLKNGSISMFELETGKEVKQLREHRGVVNCLAMTQSATILASGSLDQTTILWNMTSYELIHVLQGQSEVKAVEFSVDDKRLFTGSENGLLRVWCVSTGKLLKSISFHDRIRSLSTTIDGQCAVCTNASKNNIKLLKEDTWNVNEVNFGDIVKVSCVVATDFGNDHPVLVCGLFNGSIAIWDVNTCREIKNFEGHGRCIETVAVSDDKKYIITGDSFALLRVWCFSTGELTPSFEGHTNGIRGVAICGSRAISASRDGTVRVWTLENVPQWSRDNITEVTDIALSLDGSMCVSAFEDDTFKIWECETGKQCSPLRGEGEKAMSVAVSPDKRHFVSLSSNSDQSYSIKVWDLLCGSKINGIDSIVNGIRVGIVRFSSDGLQVIIGCNDERVVIWDWQNHDAKHIDSLQVWSVCRELPAPIVKPKYAHFASKLFYWDTSTERMVHYNQGDDSLVIRNFKTGTILHRLKIEGAWFFIAVALAPGGEFLLSASRFCNRLKLWDLRNAECVEEFHFDQEVRAIACGANGMVCVGLERGRVCFLRFNNLSSNSKQLKH